MTPIVTMVKVPEEVHVTYIWCWVMDAVIVEVVVWADHIWSPHRVPRWELAGCPKKLPVGTYEGFAALLNFGEVGAGPWAHLAAYPKKHNGGRPAGRGLCLVSMPAHPLLLFLLLLLLLLLLLCVYVCVLCIYSASAAMPLFVGFVARKLPLVCGLCGLIANVGTSMQLWLLKVPIACVRFCYSWV